MGIGADGRESELGHIGAADDRESRPAQAVDDGRVRGRRFRGGENLGSGEGDLAGDIEVVFDGDGDTGVGPIGREGGVIVAAGEYRRGCGSVGLPPRFRGRQPM